jgi:hypothetical protein
VNNDVSYGILYIACPFRDFNVRQSSLPVTTTLDSPKNKSS